MVLSRASVFEPAPGDALIAKCEAGPVIVARVEGGRKQVFFGFQLTAGELQNQLITPLLFANTVSWLSADVFQSSQVATRAPGLVEVEVGDEPEQSIAVTSPENPNLPWVLRDGRLRFFAASPGTVRVRTPSLDTQFALDLPQLAAAGWTPPDGALRGGAATLGNCESRRCSALALAGAGCADLHGRRMDIIRPCDARGCGPGFCRRRAPPTVRRPEHCSGCFFFGITHKAGGRMTFSSPWVLWFLIIPVLWAAWEWRRTYRAAGVLLKSLVFMLVILALAEPRLTTFETKMAVAVLADSSPSIPDEQIEQMRETLQRIAGLRDGNQMQVFSFDGETRSGLPSTGRPAALAAATNLEQTLRAGMAALPPGRVPRLLLISDGNENQGSLERAIHQVQERGIPVSTIALDGRKQPDLRLRALSVPSQAFSGERFTISLTVESPRATQAEVALMAEEKSIGRSNVTLAPGENTVRVKARLDAAGSALISGKISAGELGEVHFEHTISLDRPRALLIFK